MQSTKTIQSRQVINSVINQVKVNKSLNFSVNTSTSQSSSMSCSQQVMRKIDYLLEKNPHIDFTMLPYRVKS